jgi:CxxC-x17-CxxC domain-containing protein
VSENNLNQPETFNHTTFAEDSEPKDKNISCIDCEGDFVWTAGEQKFYRDKGLQNPPKRCKECKQAKNERISSIAAAKTAGVKQKIEVAVYCAKCKGYTTVPFYPSQGRPVYCRSCFLEMNPNLIENG